MSAPSAPPLTYRDAGVDIAAADDFVARIAPLAAATRRAGVLGGLGGFGALFDPAATGIPDPILVLSTDGVGTKLLLAIETGLHDTIGIDLVAMSVNDVLVQGAEPLAFLDYLATGRLTPEVLTRVVAGIAQGCAEAGCALVGGETAEMPGFYQPGHYDLAGFCLGAVSRPLLLPRLQDLQPGDVVLGLPSSGVHSNGYSLVRRILSARGHQLEQPAPFAPGQSLGEALLTPTRLYVQALKPWLAEPGLRGLAHITGGGLPGNLPRILRPGLIAELTLPPLPPVFAWLQAEGQVPEAEMRDTFNCGIGMALIVSPDLAGRMLDPATGLAEALTLGRITAAATPDAEPACVFTG